MDTLGSTFYRVAVMFFTLRTGEGILILENVYSLILLFVNSRLFDRLTVRIRS